uniref:Ovule protein n=1 Tax=Strongyloides venezuelensis TaxID=75913 RepID=A0A0K0FFR8_STRVS
MDSEKVNEERKAELMNDAIVQLEEQYLHSEDTKPSNTCSYDVLKKKEDEMNKGLFIVLDDAQVVSQSQIPLK